MDKFFADLASSCAKWTGKPFAFIMAFLLIIIWAATGPIFDYSDTWQLIINTSTTVLTFLMVFVIQNSQNRDGMAIQAKLDELIKSQEGARDDLARVEDLTEAEIEEKRS